jgi:hypothetical protein
MTRLIAPQGMNSLAVTDSKGRERVLKKDKDGTFHVSNPRLAKKLKEEGLGVAGVSPASYVEGYTCTACGFGSYFIKCGRCGFENNVLRKDGD